MRCPFRAPAGLGALAAAALCAAAAGEQPIPAPPMDPTPATLPDAAPGEPNVKRFDFDERPLGNYEDQPMYWSRLAGPGLPAYSAGRFDEEIGHAAPPSFRFTLRGGNIGYEYGRDDIPIAAGADYRVAAFVRADGLAQARALLACYLVDGGGARITGSEQVSALVGGAPTDGTWQRVEIAVPGRWPEARGLRLQLWVLQRHVWDPPDEQSLDPILRQDVQGSVWFDDIVIDQLPRIALHLTAPGGVADAGEELALQIELHGAPSPVALEVRVHDAAGAVQRKLESVCPPDEALQIALEDLPPGLYTVDARPQHDERGLLQHALRFAILSPLAGPALRAVDLAVDLGDSLGPGTGAPADDPANATDPPVPGRVAGQTADLVRLIAGLECGLVKMKLPAADETAIGPADLGPLRGTLRELATAQIGAVAVLTPATDGLAFEGAGAWSGDVFEHQFGSVLAPLAGHGLTWQLGSDLAGCARGRTWTAAELIDVRIRCARFIAAPELVLPRCVLDAAPIDVLGAAGVVKPDDAPDVPAAAAPEAAPFAWSYTVPAALPAASLPWHLAFVAAGSQEPGPASPRCWLALETAPDPQLAAADGRAEWVRRLVLAKAANADLLSVAAPLERGSQGNWQPTAQYMLFRTLFHLLGERTAVASIALPQDGVAVLFAPRAGSSAAPVLAVWTWQLTKDEAVVDLFAGPDATAIAADGRPLALEHAGDAVRVPLRAEPIFLTNVVPDLLRIQASFKLEPRVIEAHAPAQRPTLVLQNPCALPLRGRLTLEGPAHWRLAPASLALDLPPGATLTQPLEIALPPREPVAAHNLRVELQVTAPFAARLHFDVPLLVELRDVRAHAESWWEGDDLVVRHTLENRSIAPVTFTSFCEIHGRPRAEGLFSDVQPGRAAVQQYRFASARALSGARLWLGIREVGGPRGLDQLADTPP